MYNFMKKYLSIPQQPFNQLEGLNHQTAIDIMDLWEQVYHTQEESLSLSSIKQAEDLSESDTAFAKHPFNIYLTPLPASHERAYNLEYRVTFAKNIMSKNNLDNLFNDMVQRIEREAELQPTFIEDWDNLFEFPIYSFYQSNYETFITFRAIDEGGEIYDLTFTFFTLSGKIAYLIIDQDEYDNPNVYANPMSLEAAEELSQDANVNLGDLVAILGNHYTVRFVPIALEYRFEWSFQPGSEVVFIRAMVDLSWNILNIYVED